MGRYITATDIQNRMSTDAYNRVFDRNGTGADSAFVETSIDDAESELDMMLGAYVGGVYLNDAGHTVDPAIVGMLVDIALYNAVRRNPSAQAEADAPYLRGYKRALDRAKALADDDHFRARTANGFPTQPQPSIDNVTRADGITYNQPWTRAASGQDDSKW